MQKCQGTFGRNHFGHKGRYASIEKHAFRRGKVNVLVLIFPEPPGNVRNPAPEPMPLRSQQPPSLKIRMLAFPRFAASMSFLSRYTEDFLFSIVMFAMWSVCLLKHPLSPAFQKLLRIPTR